MNIFSNVKKITSAAILTLFLAFFTLTVQHAFSQTTPHISVVTAVPSSNMNVCLDSKEFITNVTNLDNNVVEVSQIVITKPEGLIYETGSAVVTAFLNGVAQASPTVTVVSNSTSITFSFPATSLNAKDDFLTLEFNISADCNIIPSREIGEPVATFVSFFSEVKVNYMIGNSLFDANEAPSNSFNIQYADIGIPILPADLTITSFKGQTLTRDIPIKNAQGAGSIDELTLKLKHDRNFIQFNETTAFLKSDINPTTVPLSFTDDGTYFTTVITSAMLNDIGLGTTLDGDESFTVTEEIKIIGCTTTSATEYTAQWGCNGSICNADPASLFNAQSTVYINQETQNPNITASFQNNTPGNFCTNPNTALITFTNTAVSAKDGAINLQSTLGLSGGVTLVKVSLDSNNDGIYDFPLLVQGSSVDFDGTNGPGLTQDPDGIGIGLEDLDEDGFYDDLPVGNSFTMEVQFNFSCMSGCGLQSPDIFAILNYNNICVSNSKSVVTTRRDVESFSDNSVNGPIDLVRGTPAAFTFNPSMFIGVKQLMQECTDKNYFVEITVPNGYVLASPDNATFDGDPVNASQTGNKITLTGGTYNGLYSVDLDLDCGSDPQNVPQNGEGQIQWELKYKCDDAAFNPSGCSCTRTMICNTFSTFSHFLCPGSGDLDACINTTSFTTERTSFGWDETQHTGFWHQSDLATVPKVNKNTPGIALDRAYEYDTVRAFVTGEITNLDCSPEEVHVTIQYTPPGTANILEFLGGEFNAGGTIYPINSGGTDYTLTFVNPNYVFDFKVPASTFSIGNLDFTADFRVIKSNSIPNGAKYLIPSFRASHYALSLGTSYGTESYGTALTILKPSRNFVQNFTSSSLTCDLITHIKVRLSGAHNGDDFPNEFRSILHLDNIELDMPIGFEYTPLSSRFAFNNTGIKQNLGFDDEPVLNGNTLVWSKSDNWLLFEKFSSSSEMTFEYKVIPHCNTNPGNSNIVKLPYIIEYTDYDFTNACPGPGGNNPAQSDCDKSLIFEDNTFVKKPNLILSAETNQPGFSDETTWTIHIENNGQGSSENTWLAFQNAPGNFSAITVLNVKDATNGNILPMNGNIVQVGSIQKNTIKQLFLTASYSNCIEGTVDRIELFAGWDCGGYPNTVTDATCTPLQSELTLTNKTANMQWEVIQTSSGPYPLCGDVDYQVTLFSTGLASMYEILVQMKLSEGVSLESASSFYNLGTNSPQVAFDPVLDDELLNWDFDPIVPEFQGNSDPIILNFTLTTDCGIDPGRYLMELQAFGWTNCQTDLSFLSNQYADFTGFEDVQNIDLTMTGSDFTADGGTTSIQIAATNTSTTTPSLPNELAVTLPPEVSYVSGSASPPILSQTSSNGKTILTWEIDAMAPLSNTAVAFDIMDQTPAGVAGSVQITAFTSYTKTVDCLGVTCNTQATTGTAEITLNLSTVPDEGTPVDCNDCIGSFAPVKGKKYVIRAWVKESNSAGLHTYINPGISLFFEGAEVLIGPFKAKGNIIDGWQKIEDMFVIPQAATNIKITLENSGNNDVFFDDIRIHPFEANMKSFVYDPVNLRLMAELDENNYATFYEYDEEGALIRVKKETERGVKTIQESRNNTKKTNP